MNAALKRQVWLRADRCCEYCRVPQDYDETPFEIDHIISRKHGGPTVTSNLALSCFWCNSFKGSNIGGLDKRTGKLTALFHPRQDEWDRHFRWQGAFLRGRTPVGRVTVAVLNMNDAFRVELREALGAEGVFPPRR
jgi:hypothetical protein